MKENIDPKHEKNLENLAFTSGILVFSYAFFSLWTWASGRPPFFDQEYQKAFIAPNAALALLLLGIYLAIRSENKKITYWARLIIGPILFLIGAMVLLEFFTERAFPINHFSPLLSGLPAPIPGPNTALCITLIGMAISLSAWRQQPTQWLLMLAQFVPIVALLGHAFRFRSVSIPLNDSPYLPISIPTALAFFIACIGLLARDCRKGLLWRLQEKSASGEVLRKIGLASFLIPILFGFTALISSSIDPHNAPFTYIGLVLLIVAIFLSAAAFVVRTLDQTEEKFQSLVENSYDSIFLVDENGRIEFVNNQVSQLLGYRAEELLGRPVESIIPDRFIHQHVVNRQRFAAFPRARPMGAGLELLAKAKDGREISVEISLTPIRIGERMVTTAVMRDVSERKQLERRQKFLSESARILSESMDYQDRLQKIAEQSVPFLGDFCVVYVAEDGCPRLGAISHRQKSIEPLLKETSELYPPAGLSRIGSEAEDVQTELYSVVNENTFRQRAINQDHLERLRKLKISSYLSVPLVARSKVIGLLALGMVDPTRHFTEQDKEFIELAAHRFAMAADNARLYHNAQSAIQNREDILSVVSHDLKTPLAAIDLSAQILGKRAGIDLNPDYVRELSRRIQRSTGHMQRLVQSLLVYGKLQSGNFTIRPSAVRIKELFRELEEMFSPLAKGKEIGLYFSCPEELSVDGDSQALFQALSNLIGNSLKFTPPRGRIEVMGSLEEGGIALSVRDTGSGMPADLQEKIFARYWQPETSKNVGSGLGLFIVKGIVNAHKGKVEVESEPGLGSCFTIRLPAPHSSTQTTNATRKVPYEEGLLAATP